MSGRTSLRAFLTTAKSTLQANLQAQGQGQSPKITFVIGNESADLDSLTSSILYAYIRSFTKPPRTGSGIYIPIANIPAADISLRPELLKLLPHANVEPSQLITLDDLPLRDTDENAVRAKLPPENTQWVLVDHNVLQGRLGKLYGAQVSGVVDHHEDEGKLPAGTQIDPRVIEKCGSCTSLVVGVMQDEWDKLAKDGATGGQAKEWDAQVARLAIASVLVDTTALQSKDKTTPKDTEAATYLEAKIGPEWDRRTFWEEIEAAKRDLDGLALQDVLRKDYKAWTEGACQLGISAVVRDLAFLRDKATREAGTGVSSPDAALLAGLEAFATERGLDVYVVMTAFSTQAGEFQRELLVWGISTGGQKVAARFAEKATGRLGLMTLVEGQLDDVDGDKRWRRAWWQKKVENSRKQVAPLLREAMREE